MSTRYAVLPANDAPMDQWNTAEKPFHGVSYVPLDGTDGGELEAKRRNTPEKPFHGVSYVPLDGTGGDGLEVKRRNTAEKPFHGVSYVSFGGTDADRIGALAVEALAVEAALWPKPGLVSPVDSGAHRDMDYGTFQRSIVALTDYFPAIAAAGAEGAGFPVLRRLGIDAEARMMDATGGVNTHRGAVFTLGFLAAAAGWRRARGLGCGGTILGDTVAALWGADILAGAPRAPASNGARAVARHGAAGARDEAAAGFPTLFRVAVPALAEAKGRHEDDDALVQTLFAIMATLEDTNLLHRGGAAGLALVREAARDFLARGGVAAPDWRARAVALHHRLIARHLSPGGAADMLAAAWFVNALGNAP